MIYHWAKNFQKYWYHQP